MFSSLPRTALEMMDWPWQQIEPYYQDLLSRPLDKAGLSRWMKDWTLLNDRISERYARLKVALDQDTTNPQAEARYHAYLDNIHPAHQAMEQKLKEKLLASGLQLENFEVPLRKMRVESALFRPANLPLLSEERKLASQYDKIIGAQSVQWEGSTRTLQQMRPFSYTPERSIRQQVWLLSAERQLADRQAINQVWIQLMDLRWKLSENAGLPDYRAYRWQQMLRLDYNPQDCFQFQQAIEQVAVPAATRIYQKHQRREGLDTLRPWDLDQDLYPIEIPPLSSYGSTADLQETAETVFRQVHPQLGEYFHVMRKEALLDLDNRIGKAPGAYCQTFAAAQCPFLFMNAVGLSTDVRTVLHESGHAFHSFERTAHQPYFQQRLTGLEFAEVASMAMELLAFPYLAKSQGGFFYGRDTSRYRISQLERILLFWPYMAVVDAFQHWIYENHTLASDPASCDAKWLELWQRFIPGQDWSALKEEAMTGWHRKQHIFRYPFYYVEYGLAQLGAVQVWRNALQNQNEAVRDYLRALALGGTVRLPELYAKAGAKFAFDGDTLVEAVGLVENTISELELEL